VDSPLEESGFELVVPPSFSQVGRVGRETISISAVRARLFWGGQKVESGFLQQRDRRNRWLDNSCAAETMLHGAPTVHLGIKHFQGPAAGVGWQRSCDVII